MSRRELSTLGDDAGGQRHLSRQSTESAEGPGERLAGCGGMACAPAIGPHRIRLCVRVQRGVSPRSARPSTIWQQRRWQPTRRRPGDRRSRPGLMNPLPLLPGSLSTGKPTAPGRASSATPIRSSSGSRGSGPSLPSLIPRSPADCLLTRPDSRRRASCTRPCGWSTGPGLRSPRSPSRPARNLIIAGWA